MKSEAISTFIDLIVIISIICIVSLLIIISVVIWNEYIKSQYKIENEIITTKTETIYKFKNPYIEQTVQANSPVCPNGYSPLIWTEENSGTLYYYYKCVNTTQHN